jgi:hypothetical protein
MVHVVWQDDRDGNFEIYYRRSTDNGSSWGPDVRLSSTPDSSVYPSVAVSGLTLHVVWQDHRDGNDEIYYIQSRDGGDTWTPDERLTSDGGSSCLPSAAVFGATIHVVWRDDRCGNFEIYYKVSYDGGLFWGPDTRLTNDPSVSDHPSVAVSSKGVMTSVHVVWSDQRDGNGEVYYKRSTDQGMTWGPDTRLTNAPMNSWYPSVATSGGQVNLVWTDYRDYDAEIYYKRSLNGGTTWESDTRLTRSSGESNFPSVAGSGSKVHVVWSDRRGGTYELYYKRFVTYWESDQGLTFDYSAYTSATNTRCIAASGDTVHVVWYDDRTRSPEIYYKRSVDRGTTWGPDTRLTYDPAVSQNPSLAALGATLHLAWGDARDGNGEIYYKRSLDGGATWGPDTRLTYAPGPRGGQDLVVLNSTVHLVWMDLRDSGGSRYEIYYKRSTDGGSTWGPDVRLTYADSASMLPAIAVSETVAHVVWEDSRDGPSNTGEIYYKRSTDGGTTWGPDIRMTYNTQPSTNPSIDLSGPNVHILWTDWRDMGLEIYYKRSTDSGTTWGPDTRLTFDPATSNCPSVAVSGPNVHGLWFDYRPGSPNTYYKRSTDNGTTWGPDIRVSSGPAFAGYQSIAISGPTIHAIWRDYRVGNSKIYYTRDPTGNPSGVVEDSEITSLRSIERLRVHPNPFLSYGRIPGHSSERFALYDISGRRVGVYKGDRIGEGLRAGVYFVRAESGGARPVRVVKVR